MPVEEFLVGGVGLTIVIGGLVYVLRTSFNLNERYLPFASLLIGVVTGLLSYYEGTARLIPAIINGGMLGLITSGGYDVIKKTVLGK